MNLQGRIAIIIKDIICMGPMSFDTQGTPTTHIRKASSAIYMFCNDIYAFCWKQVKKEG